MADASIEKSVVVPARSGEGRGAWDASVDGRMPRPSHGMTSSPYLSAHRYSFFARPIFSSAAFSLAMSSTTDLR
jgi:hypothetical protein